MQHGSKDTKNQHFLEIRDHDKLLDTCMGLKSIAKEYQQDFLRQAIRNREYYLGNQYLRAVGDKLEYRRRPRGQEWRPQTTRNVINQTINPNHAIMASASPSLNIEACFPDEPVMFNPEMPLGDMLSEESYNAGQMYPTPFTGMEAGDFSTEFLGKLWDSAYRKEYHARAVSLLDAMISGTSFRGYGMKHHPHRGPEVVVRNLQPHQVMLDPECRDMVTFSDCRFMILVSHIDVMTIKRRWPGTKEMDYGSDNQGLMYDETSSSGFFSRLFRVNSSSPAERGNSEDMQEEWSLRRYPVYMLYYAGWMPDLLVTNQKSLENQKDYPYPNGRVVTWINDKKIVEDEEVETWGFTFPVVAFTPNPVPHTGYGHAEVGKLIGPQDLINSFSNIIVSNAVLNGHTQLLVETGAMDPRTFSVSPGKIMNIARDALRGGRIKQLFPGPLGNDLLQFMLNVEHFTKEDLGDSSGILRGNAPGTVTSGLHARTIQESAFTEKSFRIGLLDNSYEMGAFKEFNMIQQYVPLGNNYYRGYMGVKEGMDLAMQNLIFKVERESRKDLPFSSGGQFELYFSMLRNGDITHKQFFELAKFKIDAEWKEKVDEAAKNAVPGMPPEMMAQMEIQAEQQAEQQEALAAQAVGGAGGLPPGAQGGNSGQGQPPPDMAVGSVGSVGNVEEV